MPVFCRNYRYLLQSTGNFETHGPGSGQCLEIPVFSLPANPSATPLNTGKDVLNHGVRGPITGIFLEGLPVFLREYR